MTDPERLKPPPEESPPLGTPPEEGSESRWGHCLGQLDRASERIVVMAERALVVGFVVFSAVLFVGFGWVRPGKIGESWSGTTLKALHDNWRAALFLLAPLLYREVTALLRRVRKAGSVGFGEVASARAEPKVQKPEPKA